MNTVVLKLIHASLLLVFIPMPLIAQESTRDKAHPQDGFPQIIKSSDYTTIKFIESIYSAIAKLNKRSVDFSDTVDLLYKDDNFTFDGRTDSTRKVVLRVVDASAVSLGEKRFTNRNIVSLCQTLSKVCRDQAAQSPCEGIRFAQFRTRAYKTRTVIEFKYKAKVVVLESDSNGPADEERLYVLDLVDPQDSFFWK